MDGFDNSSPSSSVAEIKKTEEYKTWKEEVNTYYTDLLNDLKSNARHLLASQQTHCGLQIFMAIAEELDMMNWQDNTHK